jgi:hypothetical protein
MELYQYMISVANTSQQLHAQSVIPGSVQSRVSPKSKAEDVFSLPARHFLSYYDILNHINLLEVACGVLEMEYITLLQDRTAVFQEASLPKSGIIQTQDQSSYTWQENGGINTPNEAKRDKTH